MRTLIATAVLTTALVASCGPTDPPMTLESLRFGTEANDSAIALSVADADTVYVTGVTYGSFEGQTHRGDADVFISKHGSDLSIIWARQFGTADEDKPTTISTDPFGAVYVGGNRGSHEGGSAADYDRFVIKYSAAGEVVFDLTLGRDEYTSVRDVLATQSGDVYVIGLAYGERRGLLLTKFDEEGMKLWSKNLSNPDDGAYSYFNKRTLTREPYGELKLTPDDGVFLILGA